MRDESEDLKPPPFLDAGAIERIIDTLFDDPVLAERLKRDELLTWYDTEALTWSKERFPDLDSSPGDFALFATLDGIARAYCETVLSRLPDTGPSPRRDVVLLRSLAASARARARADRPARRTECAERTSRCLAAVMRSPTAGRYFVEMLSTATLKRLPGLRVLDAIRRLEQFEVLAKIASEAADWIDHEYGDDPIADLDEKTLPGFENYLSRVDSALAERVPDTAIALVLEDLRASRPVLRKPPSGRQPNPAAWRAVKELAALYRQLTGTEPRANTWSGEERGTFLRFATTFFVEIAAVESRCKPPAPESIVKVDFRRQ